jgi:poly(A) polymerase
MLRAVRFAAKLGFNIDPDCEQPLTELSHLLQEVPAARLFEEVLKLFQAGVGLESFEKLRHYGLFGRLFPATEECLAYEDQSFPITFVSRGLENTDRRIQEDKPVTPAFLFGVLLWEPVRRRFQELGGAGKSSQDAMMIAGGEVLSAQQSSVSIPKRFGLPMREIWELQPRLEQREGKRPYRLATHPRFRAAYDFLLLRAESGEADPELAQWWTRFQEANGAERAGMTGAGKRRRPRRRRRRPAQGTADSGGGAADTASPAGPPGGE